jgi:hypothetical protein
MQLYQHELWQLGKREIVWHKAQLILSYINTALSQSAFGIYKCYIIIKLQEILFHHFALYQFHLPRKTSVRTHPVVF